MRLLLFIAFLGALAATPRAAQTGPRGLDGRSIDPFDLPSGVKAIVLVFTTIDCPISNRYAPEIERLRAEFDRHGMRFWLVYANPADTPAKIREHVQRFGHAAPVVRDPEQTLVKRTRVTVAPEAAVVDPRGRTLYRGRIDDRYVAFGVDRPSPAERDLRDALLAIGEGRPVAVPQTRAIGCVLADFVR